MIAWAIVGFFVLVVVAGVVAWLFRKPGIPVEQPNTTQAEAAVDAQKQERINEIKEADNVRLLDELRKLRK